MQLTARKHLCALHLWGDGSDGAHVEEETAAGLRQSGLKLITALLCLPARLAHGTHLI